MQLPGRTSEAVWLGENTSLGGFVLFGCIYVELFIRQNYSDGERQYVPGVWVEGRCAYKGENEELLGADISVLYPA